MEPAELERLAAKLHEPIDHEPYAMGLVGLGFLAAFAALLPVPYPYFAAMKGFYFFALIPAVWLLLTRNDGVLRWGFAAAGVLCVLASNPFFPFSFPRWLWTIVNFASAFVLLMGSGCSPRKRPMAHTAAGT